MIKNLREQTDKINSSVELGKWVIKIIVINDNNYNKNFLTVKHLICTHMNIFFNRPFVLIIRRMCAKT